MLQLASMEEQPRRLLLGSDAYFLAKVTLEEMGASDAAHHALTVSTDGDGLPDFAETDVARMMVSMTRR